MGVALIVTVSRDYKNEGHSAFTQKSRDNSPAFFTTSLLEYIHFGVNIALLIV
jgi:hypothetical protein